MKEDKSQFFICYEKDKQTKGHTRQLFFLQTREREREAAVTFGICGISPAKQPDVHHERDHPEPIHT